MEKYLSLDFWGSTAFIQAEVPFRLYRGGFPTHFPQPAQLGGGPLPTLDTGPQARKQKRGIPRRISQTRVGSPEGRNSPLWCSFLHFSHEKWRPPAGIPPGRCAPRWVKSPTTRRVRTHGGQAPGPTWQGLTCDGPNGTTSRRRPPAGGAPRRRPHSRFRCRWSIRMVMQ